MVTRDPLALPGDNLPPSLGAILSPSPALPPPASTSAAPRLPIIGPRLDIAIEGAQAALARCRADGLVVGVAVTDSQGVLLVGLQMNDADPGRIYFATRKALAALEFGEATSNVREKLRAGDLSMLARTRPNMAPGAGAVPLRAGGAVVGAIGISGAIGDQDEACAAAGAAAVAAKL